MRLVAVQHREDEKTVVGNPVRKTPGIESIETGCPASLAEKRQGQKLSYHERSGFNL